MRNHRGTMRRFLCSAVLLASLQACNSLAGLPNPFATATPTVTATATTTTTPTRTARPTATERPTPTPLPFHVDVEKQPDRTTRYTDHDGAFLMVFPRQWRVQSLPPQLTAALPDSDANIDSPLRELLLGGPIAVPGTLRLLGLCAGTGARTRVEAPALVVAVIPGKAPMEPRVLQAFMELSVMQLIRAVPDAKVVKELASRSNPNGIVIYSVDVVMPAEPTTGAQPPLPVYRRIAVFQTKQAFVMLTVSGAEVNVRQVLSTVDQIMDSVRTLQPQA